MASLLALQEGHFSHLGNRHQRVPRGDDAAAVRGTGPAFRELMGRLCLDCVRLFAEEIAAQRRRSSTRVSYKRNAIKQSSLGTCLFALLGRDGLMETKKPGLTRTF